MDVETTIVAVSSPIGNSPRLLVRASGKQLFDCVTPLGIVIEERRMTTCSVEIAEGTLPILCLSYPATCSYTGQETIEIELPNNTYLIQSLMETLITVTNGRFATAGEFTARAFFNGKMSLSQAEGVCATISAQNDNELQGAALLRTGSLNSIVTKTSALITKTLALVESGIDFTDEEDVVAISNETLYDSIQKIIQSIEDILSGTVAMETLRNLPRVVIAGLPNAGKSTLFNALLGRHRVVVSSLKGTTRDAIQEPIWFGAKEAICIDIAGFEPSSHDISISAQEKAHKVVEQADVVVWCVDPTNNSVLQCSIQKKLIVVHTKSDLSDTDYPNSICAISGSGMGKLVCLIEQQLGSAPFASQDAIALLPRHEHCLKDSLHSLLQANQHIQSRELVAASLREALNSIGVISGKVTPDDILGEVFSTFCIGK